MQYAVTVIVEADTLKAAVLKIPDDLGEVASATPRPNPNLARNPAIAALQQSGQVVNMKTGEPHKPA